MNAKEAREKSLQITGDKEKNQYDDIQKRIINAVNTGQLSLYYYSELMPAVTRKLQEEGYKVERDFDQREGVTIKISW